MDNYHEQQKLKMREYYQSHKEELKLKMNEYYKLHRNKMKDQALKNYHENKNIIEKYHDMKTYHRNYYHLRRKNNKDYNNYHLDYYQTKKYKNKNKMYDIPIRKYKTFLVDNEIPEYSKIILDKPIINRKVNITMSKDSLIVEI